MNAKALNLLSSLLLATLSSFAQVAYPSLSPKGTLTQMVGNTQIEIEYERPSARNRKVYGELVPWNKVWRTGAGYCTKIRCDQPVLIGGQSVPAGKYALLTLPNPEEWVVILNTDTTLYSGYRYDSQKDIARFIARPTQTERFYETLTFDIDLIPNNARIYLSWEQTQISFELITTTDQNFMAYLDGYLLTQKEQDGERYANAAEQLYFMNARLQDALRLCDIALDMHQEGADYSTGFVHVVKMHIYEKLHLYDQAIREIAKALKTEKDQREQEWWQEHQARIEGKM